MRTKITTYIFCLAALSLLWGCSSEEDNSLPVGAYPLVMSVQVKDAEAPILRSVADIGNTGVFVSGGTTYNNAQYTGTAGTLTPQIQGYWGSTNNISIYAYAPYQATAPTSVSVKAGQSSNADYTASDFLYATPETFTFANRNNVSLTFKHHLSRINLTLVAGEGINLSDLSNAMVRIAGMNTTASIALANGTLGALSNVQTVTPNPDGTNKYKAIVIPQTVTANTMLFEVAIDAVSFGYVLPATQEFKTGGQYNYTVTLSQGGITVSPVEIKRWTEEEKDNNGIAN